MESERGTRNLVLALLYLLALVLPILLAPPIATWTGWPIQSTVTRLLIVFGVSVLLFQFGVPRPDPDLRRHVRTAVLAMGITVGATALYSTVLVLTECESVRPWDQLFKPQRFATALATALAVSMVEEPVFRGFLLRRLSLRGKVAVGAALSSAAYALVHYMRPGKFDPKESYGLDDSAAVYLEMVASMARPLSDPAPGIGLVLFALLLCAIVRRGGLAWTIGIHAGVVYYVKVDASVLYWNHVDRHFYFGSFDLLYDGALFWIVCAVPLAVMASYRRGTAAGPQG